ncbi:glucose 1-dehydrogenase [Paenibacillus sp. KACC 21273]|uniref:SDR family NAD(P)-dependent oxidoreductase n=1 Tax=Paenibacillus sp. KACC 21273 TaxID=3025665 RepID=UPI0023664AFF|nr:glucose 1-dehydrogenase [Paenibacillus sp. KACC 21273]WDF48858.1 glucose 1-dehydrogenase [Paenibacillus sp. KACC 21273]
MTFENKTVIVTGGGTGIGKATAQRFFDEGANVVINGRREDVLQQTAHEIDPTGQKVRIAVGDISLQETAKKLVDVALEAFGGIDILVNNTGKFNPTPFLEHTADDLDSYLNTIVKGTFFPSQAVIPEMKKRGGGAIINTGSMWATQAVEATPSSAYSAAMAGRHALTRNMAIEFAADGIRVNAVAPAVVETPIYNTFLSDEEVAEVLPGFNAFHPLGRNGAPKDIADAILFLASDSASWITGIIMPLDGGVTARLR